MIGKEANDQSTNAIGRCASAIHMPCSLVYEQSLEKEAIEESVAQIATKVPSQLFNIFDDNHRQI
jgi:hypothetical protein